MQYARWTGQLLHGNFGYSYTSGRPVAEVMLERLYAAPPDGGAATG